MKDKIKARYEAIKDNPFQRGLVIGGLLGVQATVAAGLMFRVNLDDKGLYIPQQVIDAIHQNGFAIGIKNGTRIVLAAAPEVQ